MRNDPGLSPLSEPPSLEGLDDEERVDAMVNWFYENFEDPAQETPYNGREGGYLYVHGGPYEAQNYIIDAFPDATEDEHIEAIDRIDADGPDFAPAGHRVLAPEEDYEERDEPPLDYRLDLLSAQLETIGKSVEDILALQRPEKVTEPGIGHNNPPAAIDTDQPDLREVLESIREVKAELAKPDRTTTADPEVVERAQSRFERFLAWLNELKGKAPMALALGGVGAAGKMLFEYAVEHHAEIQTAVISATHTMSVWTSWITGVF